MNITQPKRYSANTMGILLAILAAIIWSGNFIIARGISSKMPPVSLAFYRWFFATLFIAPFAWPSFKAEKAIVLQHKAYFFCIALTGFTFYNVFLYVAGHYTSAINLALIGTTSAPIFAVAIGALFFNEKISAGKLLGMVICFLGVLLLLSKGSWQVLLHFHFSSGDLFAMLGAFSFSIYNNLAKHKPTGISNINFLFVGFVLGVCMLVPMFIVEALLTTQSTIWTQSVVGSIAYLSIGCSFGAYLFWNKSILLIGPSRTVLFGNLIPIFSTIEAVFLLHEQFMLIQLISGLVVIIGLAIANFSRKG
ncbi:DMT family transporter [Parasediminibacterium sp. JCM 36343]|uniref:DMT family transporter n=1 Tax=Parasediminibacterium sp. JCM 36343 TaxID=3374279 RepID=UPI00397C5F3D